ncbi:MAG TPA: DUF2339 domain-containing protein, partial [Polyangiaceae bacterium]|nr:DUF2339 domain-containing protein [Polyangiaceae bacterium]
LAVGGLLLLPILSMVAASRVRERMDRLVQRVETLERSREALEAGLRRSQVELAELRKVVAASPAQTPRVPRVADAARAGDEPTPVAPAVAPSVAPTVDPSPPAPKTLVEAVAALGARDHVAEASADAATPAAAAPVNATPAPEPAAPEPAAPEPAVTPPAVTEPGATPPAASPASRASPATPAPPTSSDWERWIGVRGAAVLGGVVLALAAILFFRYAVEHSLVPPIVRVVTGTLLGVGCVLGAERLRARYDVSANALAGAGLVALYAAFWAARVSYELIGMELAFGLMALTTATGCLLAVRHASLLIAVLVLVGGFATPLLLSSGSDRPIGLFGYVLLLDTGFVLVARKRGWGVLLALALAGTLLIEALWIGLRMGSERVALGAAVVVVFAVLFGLAGAAPVRRAEGQALGGSERGWWQTRAAAVVLSFGFALYFASQASLGVRLVPVAAMLGVLSFGAGWVARREQRASWLPLAAAVASATVVAIWCHGATLTPASIWEAALCAAGLGLVFQLNTELSRDSSASAIVSSLAQFGLLAVLIAMAMESPLPNLAGWLTGELVLMAALAWTGERAWRGHPALAGGALLGFGLLAFQSQHRFDDGGLAPTHFFELELAIGVALSLPSLLRRSRADHVLAAVFPCAVLSGLCLVQRPSVFAGTELSLAFVAGLGALAAFALTRRGEAHWLGASSVLLALAQHTLHEPPEGSPLPTLAILALTLAFAAGWPLLVLRALAPARWAALVSALAAPLWFFDLREAWLRAFGASLIGLLPVALGALSLAVLWHLRRSSALDPELRRSGMAGYAALALGFASVAIPLQLDRQWITLGWALESAAVLVLFRRLNHAGLKWFGLLLATAVTVRLVLNPSVLEYEARGWPLLNWLLYTYWVPALALLGGHFALRDLELARVRPWEAGAYHSRQPIASLALAGAVVAVLFVWLNLAIFDAFAEGSKLVIDLDRRPSRDLTLSLGWAAYAGVLSALGMLKRSRGLRWVSLAIWLLTVGKVFLYDLGQLRDLYRVLSLLGLAVSLIGISLAYQRFVFNDKPQKEGT